MYSVTLSIVKPVKKNAVIPTTRHTQKYTFSCWIRLLNTAKKKKKKRSMSNNYATTCVISQFVENETHCTLGGATEDHKTWPEVCGGK